MNDNAIQQVEEKIKMDMKINHIDPLLLESEKKEKTMNEISNTLHTTNEEIVDMKKENENAKRKYVIRSCSFFGFVDV